MDASGRPGPSSPTIRIAEQVKAVLQPPAPEAPVASDDAADDNDLAKYDGDLEHGRKQTFRGAVLLWLGFQSCGVVYGDIGTSPLYVFSSTFTAQPSWDDLVGALSIILWSLTLIVSVKYVCIVLLVDDDGRGGTFALYSLLSRYARIATPGPPSALASSKALRLQRYGTGDMQPASRRLRSFIEGSPACQHLLKLAGVLGVSMVMADGVLTPAQSVVRPGLGTPVIVGVTCAILVLLFLVQPFGTARLGTAFAAIVVVWLLFNMAAGIYNLVVHDHSVLKACSPHYTFLYLARNGTDGWRSLGGLLLAFTGVEALFADLAAFGRRAIQLSWLCLAFPCLLLAYAGRPRTSPRMPPGQPFPPGTFYFSMVLAILAAIVASQAMVTTTFQLLVQVMRLSYFPRIRVVHTSRRFHDHVYVPLANWLLLVGTVVVTAVYNNTTSLGNAYGVCVIFVTFLTTCMLALVALLIWRLPVYLMVPVFAVFAALDGTYLSAVLTKVPEAAWFTLLLALLLSSVFVLWRFGKEAQWAAEAALALSPPPAASTVSSVPGLGVFFDKLGDPARAPPCFAHFVRKFSARPAVLVFFHMRPLDVPVIPAEERYLVTRHHCDSNNGSDNGGDPSLFRRSCYTVILRHGYAEEPLRPGIAADLVAQVDLFLHRDEIAALHEASRAQVVYLLGKEAMRVRSRGSGGGGQKGNADATARKKSRGVNVWAFGRRLLLELFLWIRDNSRTKLASFDMEIDKMVEVGYLTEL
ncbi:hypothetical protein SCUCBS95973_007385 [Sporothrix curviconia]|uniref:Potassium uptake protein n=1 Tax=Sporothrix curviconia TaxID=1260050 RepID=A0ABP0CFM3_9PEZI